MSETTIDIEGLWSATYPNEQGLVPCVAQDLRTRGVLMVAWVSREALQRSVESGWATYYSRSRQTLWVKGETSGHKQRLVNIRLDCDGDTLLYLVEAVLPACHEGTDTCFSRRQSRGRWIREPVILALTESPQSDPLEVLETVIDARAEAPKSAKPSYTRRLLDGGIEKQVAKIREESEELGEALHQEPDGRVISEAADVLYHMAVALRGRGLSFSQVLGELEGRMGTSGLDEKTSRSVVIQDHRDVGADPYAQTHPSAGSKKAD